MTQTRLQRRLVRVAASMNSKARRLGARGRVTAELLYLVIRDYPRCPYCGIEIDPDHGQFDHRLAFDKGGSNTRDNIVFCCVTCNRQKFTKSTTDYSTYQRLEVICGSCGITFRPRWSDWDRGLGKYCSRSCSAKSRWIDS